MSKKTDDYLRNEYLPKMVKAVIQNPKANIRDFSDDDFVGFCQGLYDIMEQKKINILEKLIAKN